MGLREKEKKKHANKRKWRELSLRLVEITAALLQLHCYIFRGTEGNEVYRDVLKD